MGEVGHLTQIDDERLAEPLQLAGGGQIILHFIDRYLFVCYAVNDIKYIIVTIIQHFRLGNCVFLSRRQANPNPIAVYATKITIVRRFQL
jgi:hypothetical protein